MGLKIQLPAGLFAKLKLIAGLCTIGSGETISMCYVLVAGLRAVIDTGWARCRVHKIWCGFGLGSGLVFGESFVSLMHPE